MIIEKKETPSVLSRSTGMPLCADVCNPRVTVITATFNDAHNLAVTVKSIREQSYKNIEWIVIDGGSKDHTVEMLRKNEDVISYWVSEPDSGIYDAWNKGVLLAKGEWISFLGAGDVYHHEAVEAYMKAIHATIHAVDFVSSRVRLVDSSDVELKVLGASFDWDVYNKYMCVAHVGAFHHKRLFEKYGLFDTTYSSAGDYEFLMRCGAGINALFLPDVTVNMLSGGISNGRKGVYETYQIQKKQGAGLAAEYRLCLALMKSVVRPWLRGY